MVSTVRDFFARSREPLAALASRCRTVLVPPAAPLLPLDLAPAGELGRVEAELQFLLAEFLRWVAVETSAAVPDATPPPCMVVTQASLELAAGCPYTSDYCSYLADRLWDALLPARRKRA